MLQRKYRLYKFTQWGCFFASIISATVPPIAAAINVAPALKDNTSKLVLAGYAVFILVLVGLIVWRGLSKKLAHKIPWALGVGILAWGLTALLFSLQKIIDNALYIAFMFAIGATVAFVLSIIADLFKMLAAHVKEEWMIQRIKE